jgi:hypothetical protein
LKDVPKFDKSDIAKMVLTMPPVPEFCRIPLNSRLECKMGSRRAEIKWEDEFT